MAHLGLADAVDAAEPLLEAVGVPRQVVIDHQVGPLEVDALARGVRGEQHPHVGVVLERLLCLQPLLPAQGAVDDHHGLLAAQQRGDSGLQVVQGVPMLGEDDELLVRRGRRRGDFAIAFRQGRRSCAILGRWPW